MVKKNTWERASWKRQKLLKLQNKNVENNFFYWPGIPGCVREDVEKWSESTWESGKHAPSLKTYRIAAIFFFTYIWSVGWLSTVKKIKSDYRPTL
jgi:hypothetical protein